MKVKDLITWSNCLFVFHHVNGYLPDDFESYLHNTNEHQNHAIRGPKMFLDVHMKRNLHCGSNSVFSCSIFDWNNIIKKIFTTQIWGEHSFLQKSINTSTWNNNNSWICSMHIIPLFTLYLYSLFSQWIIKL